MNQDPNLLITEIRRERTNRAWVRGWLYLVALLILAIVMVGGMTRLTDSGLSITEWKPIHGVIPPLNDTEWLEEFAKYQQIPEYQQVNPGMTLAGFKVIFWWEWAHRLLGRLVGVVFAVPLAIFWLRRMLEPHFKPRLLLMLAFGGLQGAIGWWMVTSGLVDRVDVSQYRLAIHLTLAAAIFAYALWLARGLAKHTAAEAPAGLAIFAAMTTMAILAQLFLGALVAGLDAGLAFNDWPTMDGAIVPTGLDTLEPLWRNWFENPKAVQFNHRIGGYVVALLVAVQFLKSMSSEVDAPHRRRAAILLILVLCQLALGVATLTRQVPLDLALAHQLLAFGLLGFSVAHWRGLTGAVPVRSAIRLRT